MGGQCSRGGAATPRTSPWETFKLHVEEVFRLVDVNNSGLIDMGALTLLEGDKDFAKSTMHKMDTHHSHHIGACAHAPSVVWKSRGLRTASVVPGN